MSRVDLAGDFTAEQLAVMTDGEKRMYLEVQDLRQKCEQRFWRLVMDENSGWYGIEDSLGREIHPAVPNRSLRGYFATLPPQA